MGTFSRRVSPAIARRGPATPDARRGLAHLRTLPWGDLAGGLAMLVGWRAATWLFGALAAGSVEAIPPPLDAADFLRRASLQGEALWHIWIAQGGYGAEPHGPQIAAFPPLFAFLIQTVQRASHPWALAAGLVAHAALAAALAYLVALARLDRDRDDQLRATAAALLWPAAPFLGAASPDSLLLLTLTAALYHARRGQWWAAGCWALLAGLTRGSGLLIAIPLFFEWRDRAQRGVRGAGGWAAGPLAIIAAPLGFATFLAILTIQTGSPYNYFRAQEALGSGSLPGLRTLLELPAILADTAPAVRGYAAAALPFPTALIPAIIDGGALAVAALAGLWLLRERRSYGTFVLAGVATVALLYGLPDSPRHLLGLAPLYLALGRWARHPLGGYLAATVGLALLALTTFLQVNGLWAG